MQIKDGYQNITSDKTGYYLGDKKYPRVSTILQNIDKRPLIKWAVRLACEKVDTMLCDSSDIVNENYIFNAELKNYMLAQGKNEHIRQFEEAQEYGSLVHDKIECWLKKCPEPKKSYPADWLEPANKSLQSFIDFWQKGKYELIKSEMAVIHKKLGYGGRIDILAKQGDEIIILDIKTGKSVWKSHKIQCALYALALEETYHCEMLSKIDKKLYFKISKSTILHIPKINPKVKPIELAGEEFDASKKAGLDLVSLYYNLKGVK